ncbi:unnamed protein product [Nezara viridula]|uniref:BESS domain-containing protein n=1 Tax=Nezara viridula TaxID=85310 RepID=A0A9P0HCW7_NEZVI|nr:unnamed protein product [Nezara viridula]
MGFGILSLVFLIAGAEAITNYQGIDLSDQHSRLRPLLHRLYRVDKDEHAWPRFAVRLSLDQATVIEPDRGAQVERIETSRRGSSPGHHGRRVVDGVNPGKCKQRWESLRSQFRKHVRNQKSKTRDSCATPTKWRYGENLQFLLPYMKERMRISSIDGSDDIEEEAEVSQESNEPIPQVKLEPQKRIGELPSIKQEPKVRKTLQYETAKRKFPAGTASFVPIKSILSERRKDYETDEYDLFFDAMKKTIKKFSAADKLLVKRQLFNMVAEIEEKYVNDRLPVFQTHYQQMYLANTQFGRHIYDPSQGSHLRASYIYEDTSESQPSSPASVHSGKDGDCSPRLEAALESRSTGSGALELAGFALHSPLRSAPLDMYVTDMRVKAADRLPRVEKCRFDRGTLALQAKLGFKEMIVSGKVELVGDGHEGKCNMTLRMRRPGLGVTVLPQRPGRARLGLSRLSTAATFVEPQFISVHAYGCKRSEKGRGEEEEKEEVTEEMEDVFMKGVRSLITRYMEARLEPALKDSLMLSLGYTLSYGR